MKTIGRKLNSKERKWLEKFKQHVETEVIPKIVQRGFENAKRVAIIRHKVIR